MWLFKNNEINAHSDLLPECTNFVYIIEYTNGQKYIGKKCVRSNRKRPPLKGKKRNRRVMINHPFIKYEGSHENPDNLEISYKEILYQCSSKNASAYLECALMYHYDAIFDPLYLNKSISGVYYENVLDGLLE